MGDFLHMIKEENIKQQRSFVHTPIMVDACIDMLKPERGGIFVDCTLGGGGHSEAILLNLSKGHLFGIDRDEAAISAATKRLQQYELFSAVRGNFFDMKQILTAENIKSVDGILADLGVSSYQLDEGERGFSYQHDARLDMRMDRRNNRSAYDIVNDYSEQQLTNIFQRYGEEKWSSRIAKFIVKERQKAPIETTYALVDVIKAAIPASARREGPHPAKRTFQAIRIEVNGELDQLAQAVEDLVDCLAPEGRLAIITFHSLEDRIVKQTFLKLANPCTCPPKIPYCVCGQVPKIKLLTRKPIIPTQLELEDNPRARSAKLRVVERLGD